MAEIGLCSAIHLSPLCTARLMAQGCQSAEGNANRGGAEALKLRPSLRSLPLTEIPQPQAWQYPTCAYYHEIVTSSTKRKYITYCIVVRQGPTTAQVTWTQNFVKFGDQVSEIFERIDRHTDALIAIPRTPPGSEVIKQKKL